MEKFDQLTITSAATKNIKSSILDNAKNVLSIESLAISSLIPRLGQAFVTACQHILDCQGSIILTGMGKSGHIARKLAATFASTGTPAFFLHPAEASHGDLGVLTKKDVVIALSNSGETSEILLLLPTIKRLGIPFITLTGIIDSQLATTATVNLDISVEKEACPLGLAPTASTISMLAIGDALAISVLSARGFTATDFARSHPGGKLGKRLCLRVADIMLIDPEIPMVTKDALLLDAIIEISNKRLGMTTVINHTKNQREIIGIFTDGDLRRTLEKKINIHTTKINEVMSTKFKTIDAEALASEAAYLMETCKITALAVVNKQNHLIGALNIHHLLAAGVI